MGLVSSYFRDHNLLRLTRGLFLLHDSSSFAFHLFAESEDDHSRIAHDVQAAAASLTAAVSPRTKEVLAALWTSARAWEKNADQSLARWIPPVGQGHVFRACYGLALALTVNFWMNEYFNRNPPSDTREPAPET